MTVDAVVYYRVVDPVKALVNVRDYPKAVLQVARAMAATPAAFQSRLLQTVVDVAAEKYSALVMPFPVELLRFFDRVTKSSLVDLPEPAQPPGFEPAGKTPVRVAARHN